MEQMVKLIADYAAADEERRLSMYLTHRDLRRHFTAIDMAAAKQAGLERSEKTHAATAKHGSICIFGACWGWLKYCRSLR